MALFAINKLNSRQVCYETSSVDWYKKLSYCRDNAMVPQIIIFPHN